MPSVTYMNQSAPFWDFIASLEREGSGHPMFSQTRNEQGEERQEHEAPQFDPFGWGGLFGGRGMPHRSPHPPGPPPQQHEEEKSAEKDNEKTDATVRDGNDNGEGPSGVSGSDNEAGRGRHGRCGGDRRHGRPGPGGPGGFGGRHGPPHHGHHGPRGFGRRGGWGPWGRGGMDAPALVAQLWDQFNDSHPSNTPNTTTDKPANDNADHTPEADIFDTEDAYVVHISLPGAKKEDVGVNWDTEKSELSVAGVIYRPGDEDFLKTLAMSERKVGAFERKIRLGTRALPAHIDVEAISAKLEDGILRVEVPKLDAGYVEIRKVDIE
jgi:HSP20 family protein